MKLSYDSQADALYIDLQEGLAERRVVRLTEDVAVDYGADGEVVGLEVLHAHHVLGGGERTPVVDLLNLRGRPARD